MRSRLKLHCKALFTAAGFSGMVLALTFFFYDGPLHPPELIATAQATQQKSAILSQPKSQPKTAGQQDANLHTEGWLESAQWVNHALDGDAIRLRVLKSPLTLADTTHQSGLEAFEYAAALYGQMARQIPSQKLSAQLAALQLKAQAMAHAMRQAAALRFEGPPMEDMTHLQVHAVLANHLGQLHAGSQVTARYSHHGQLLEETKTAAQPGKAMLSYQDSLKAILQNPEASQFPQSMDLIRQESAILAQLASHLALRWDSVHYCPQECQPVSTDMRIYMQQTLPAQTLASAAL
jgi:hypothetical protein